MICPNCNHKEEYDFYICPKCQYILDIDPDPNESENEFETELQSLINSSNEEPIYRNDDLTYQLDVSELIFEEDLSIKKKNPLIKDNDYLESSIDEIIKDVQIDDSKPVFESKGMSSRLIGRDSEIFNLRQIYQEAKINTQACSITIVGEAGVGKTRFISEFFSKLRENDSFRIELQAKLNSKNEDYSIFKSILQKMGKISENDLKEIQIQKLKIFLKENTPFHLYHELKGVFHRLLKLKSSEEIEKMDIMSFDRILKRSFRHLFSQYTSKKSLIIAIKDIHNSDIRSMDMIEYFLSLPNFKNIIFIMTSEPQDRIQRFLKGESFRRYYIQLQSLSMNDTFTMIKEILKEIPKIDSQTLDMIAKNTKGLPFHIEESIKYFMDSNVLVQKKGKVTELDEQALRRVKIPTTIEERIQAKFDRIDPFQYILLQLASIAGKVFYKNYLQVLINVDLTIIKNPEKKSLWMVSDLVEKIDFTLDTLINSGIIIKQTSGNARKEQEFRFNHDSEQQYLYNSIPENDRKLYHNYLAQYLESKSDTSVEVFIELISHQYKNAGEFYKAAKYFFMAGERAEERYANRKAIEYYEEALKILPQENALFRIEILHNLGSLYNLIGKIEPSIQSFKQMAQLAIIIIHYNKVGAAYNKIGRICRDQGEHEKAERYLQQAYDYFNMGRDRRGIASTQDDMGRLYWQKGLFDKALQRYMTSLEIRKKLNDTISIALSLNNIGLLYYSQGFVKEAEEYLLEAYKLRKENKDRKGEMASLNNMATLTYNKGDDAQAKALWMKSLTIAEEIGDVKFQAICLNNLGELLLENNQLNKAEDYIKNALEIALETSNKRILAHNYLNLGELSFKQREVQKAKIFLNQALDLGAEIGDNQVKGRVLCIFGDIEAETIFNTARDDNDGVEPAENYYLQSSDILRKVSEPLMAQTNISYAQYLFGKGKKSKAKKLLLQAETIYENYNMQLKLSNVRRLKKELNII
ncbi:tetratricopeptide repeat protein [bacterium]|nr:tetratricopeptide repeat protein [bacterium]